MQHSAGWINIREQGYLESLQLHHDLCRASQPGLGQLALRVLACAVVAWDDLKWFPGQVAPG